MGIPYARVHQRRALCIFPPLCFGGRDSQRPPPSPTGDSPVKAPPNVTPSQPPPPDPPRPTPAAETSVLVVTQTVTPPPLPSPTAPPSPPPPPPPTSPLPSSPPSPPSPNESQVALAGGGPASSLLSAAAASIITETTTAPISVTETPTSNSINIINNPESGPTSTPVASSTLIPLTSSSAAVTSTIVPTQNGSQNSHSPVIPAIVGSVVGAVVICMMIVLACLWRRRRNKKRNENNWKWFDYWKRQHRGVSFIMDVDVENQAEVSGAENEKDVDTLSVNSSRAEQRRIRVVSMGYVTNQTGTTSNTNFVVAKPPTTFQPSNGVKIGSFTYEPRGEGSNDHSKQSRVTSSEILTDAGRRNVELLYKSKPT